MKQLLLKRMAIAAIALCAVPGSLLAQDEKEKTKAQEKKERQQIVITRSGDKTEKTVIEIDGDKVKVNGKDVADLKDVQVHVNNLKNSGSIRLRTPSQGTFNMTFDDFGNGRSLFAVDSNRAMLGVTTESDDKGAEIRSITKESGAEKAGLKKGDIITKINNRKIDGADDVTDAIRSQKPGDKVSITYLREGKEQKATAELSRWKGIDMATMVAPKALADGMFRESINSRTFERFDRLPGMQGNVYATSASRPRLGLVVQDTDDGKGVKVLEVEDDGTAHKAGIQEGDVITHLDDKGVNSADEISKIMKEKKDQPSVRFQVNRNGKSQNIEVKVPRKLKTVDL
ncbi:MAG TPA: PDZ domain-containing protein [Flavisolibacter sp.]|nr:PDZ domain-containing protein [Flavisolibacter sp.]